MKKKAAKKAKISILQKKTKKTLMNGETHESVLPDETHIKKLIYEHEVQKIEQEIQTINLQYTDAVFPESALEWQSTFDGVNDGICLLDTNQRIVRCNKIMTDFFPQLRGNLIGLHCWEVVHGTKEQYIDCPVAKMIKSLQRETNIQMHNDKWFQVSADPLLDKDYNLIGTIHIVRDITEIKITQEKLQGAKDYAENLIQTTNAIVVGLDTNGNITTYNQAAEEITGYTLSELEGRNWFETLVPRNRYPQVWEVFEKLMTGGLPKYFENPILTKSGNERYIIWHNNEVSEKGKITGTISFGIDITERRQTEEALKESENRFHKIFDTSPIGMTLIGPNLNFVHVNQSFCDFIGYTEQELMKLTNKEITHPDNLTENINSVRKLISGELAVYQTENKYIRKDKKEVWGNVNTTPIFDSNGVLRYFLAMIKDIDDQKKAEAEILRINEDLRIANAAKDKFFSIIAHDLKSPFSSILGFADLLKDETKELGNATLDHYVSLIYSSAYNTYQLLENLLEWARMQCGQISFSPRSLLLDKLISDEIEVLRTGANQKNIQLLSNVPENLLVQADENMLTAILRNLISNAIKFTPKGGEIEVSAVVNENNIQISVSDTGIGMTSETIEKLFKIETASTTPGTENEKGTGLGLLLCKEFIEKHGGKIWAESGPIGTDNIAGKGKGSKFYFTIPRF